MLLPREATGTHLVGPGVERVTAAVRRRMGLAVAASYAVAALLPGPGLWLRQPRRLPAGVTLHPTLILLALMLFTASSQVPVAEAGRMLRRPRALLAGLACTWPRRC